MGKWEKTGLQGNDGHAGRGYGAMDGMSPDEGSSGASAAALLALVALAVIPILLFPGAASANITHPFQASFGAFSNPESLAIDQASGDVYVLDVGSSKIGRFTAAGAPDAFSASGSYISGNELTGTPSGGFSLEHGKSESEIAVAPAGALGGTSGDLYVTESAAGVVDIFSSTGEYLGRINGTGGEICGVATDLAGNVYVGSFGGHIDKYVPSANPPTDADLASQIEGVGGICNLAADSTGAVYATTWSGSGYGAVTKYEASQFGGAGSGIVVDPAGSQVAVDWGSDDAYVDEGDQIAQFSSSGTLRGRFGSGQLSESHGVAVNGSTEKPYASRSSTSDVAVFGPPVTLPSATTEGVTENNTGTSATLHGTVNPEGVPTTWQFEYGTDVTYGKTAPVPAQSAGEGTAPIDVSVPIADLESDTIYHYRLVAIGDDGATPGEDKTFRAAPKPSIESESVSSVSAVDATLKATINPGGLLTTYRFEYGTDTTYGNVIPSPEQSVGEGEVGVPVQQSIVGLQPGVTYHYRAVATNVIGPTEGADQTFTTWIAPASGLPDGRAYEMVSPPDKHGVNINHNLSVQGALNGDAAVFSSLGGFADAPSAGVTNYYRAERTGGEWLTRGISPPLSSGGTELLSASMMALSPDLTSSVMQTLPAPPVVPGTQLNSHAFYRHSIIPDGPFENLTPLVPDPETFGSGDTRFAGTDDSVDTIGITTAQKLTPDAPDGNVISAYVWKGGSLHFIAIFPDETAASSNSFVGTQCCGENKNAVSSDGSQVVFSATYPGDAPSVYLRSNLTSTIEASASQRTPPDPAGPKTATFQGASSSGNKVLFSTDEELVNADTDASRDMYLFVRDSNSLRRISTDENPVDGIGADVVEVLDSSEDASYVYFAARGLLVPGQPETPGMKLYAWHDDGSANGVVSYIATLDPSIDFEDWEGGVLVKRPHVQVSPGGRYFAFTARTRLDGYDNAGHAELYLYDSSLQQTVCMSCDASEEAATGDAALYGLNAKVVNGIGDGGTGFNSRNVFDDGHVFFETADALVPQDSNGKIDVYEWENGRVFLISSGTDATDSHYGNASANGNDVFFLTQERLVGIDVDPNIDLYDARVGGGLASQNPPKPAAPCQSDGCRGEGSEAPVSPNPGSASFSGKGSATLRHAKPRHCTAAKRKAAKRGARCAGKRKHQKRKASHHGGAGR